MRLWIVRHGDPDYEHDTLTEKISNMKSRLGKIVQEYGYKTVDEFYRMFNNAASDYSSY